MMSRDVREMGVACVLSESDRALEKARSVMRFVCGFIVTSHNQCIIITLIIPVSVGILLKRVLI